MSQNSVWPSQGKYDILTTQTRSKLYIPYKRVRFYEQGPEAIWQLGRSVILR